MRPYERAFDKHIEEFATAYLDSDNSDNEDADNCPICLHKIRPPVFTLSCGHKGCGPYYDYYFVQIHYFIACVRITLFVILLL